MIQAIEKLRILTPKNMVYAGAVGLLALGSIQVADKVGDVFDFMTPELPDLPEALQDPPATIEIDDLHAVYEAVSSRLVHEKTERVEDVEFKYDNRDVEMLPSWVAGSNLEQTLRGEVTAYVDLSKIKKSDIRVTDDGRGLSIRLPNAEHDKTVLDPDLKLNPNGGLWQNVTGAKETEEVVRDMAGRALTDVAVKNGLLQQTEDEASESIRNFISLLLSAGGVDVVSEDIEVQFEEENPESTVSKRT